MKSGVYKITCLSNDKIYIGSSKHILGRIEAHKIHLRKNKHRNPHLQNAWDKYGEENFTFEILEECDIENLLEREQYWMDYTLCYNRENGFNNCIKSDSPLGYRHTEEDKLRMSIIKKEQIKNGIAKPPVNTNYKPHSEESKEKIRKSKLGDKNPMFGKVEEEEHKKRRMESMLSKDRWNKGLTIKDDERLKKLATWKGKLPPNAIKHTLVDLETQEMWEEKSLTHLSLICPLSLSTLVRLKRGDVCQKLKIKYKIIW